MPDLRSDSELLRQLREDGDDSAYVALWQRHIGTALRYANRSFHPYGEDLASEAFLAIYDQVKSGKGPDRAFVGYLKAVMRNIGIRWRKEERRIDDSAIADTSDMHDALSLVERESSANELLTAFLELPERWQRVLWLSEVTDTPRPRIAAELGVQPNAVSALHRRARNGLKLHWLEKQIPLVLRDDETHVARLLPRYLSSSVDKTLAAEVDSHLPECKTCSDLLLVLRSDARRLQGVTLSAAGFGALGIAIPSSALLPGATAAAAVIIAGGSGLLTVGLSALGAGTLIVASLFIFTDFGSAPPPPAAASAPVERTHDAPLDALVDPPEQNVDTTLLTPAPFVPAEPDSPPPPAPSTSTGRQNDNPAIENVDVVGELPSPPTRPDRPPVAPVTTPDPSEEPETPAALTPGVSSPTTSSSYMAPKVTGTTTPGSSVAVEFRDQRYTPVVASDGSWAFDARSFDLPPGTYEYRAWAFDDTAQSAATTGTFTVLPLAIQGFEGLTGFNDMLVSEAKTTGLVIAVTGPANGTVVVNSMQGHQALISLNASGNALVRLRMNSWGWYALTFRAVDTDNYMGAGVERYLDVYDPDVIWSPWGPGDENMTFEFEPV